MDLFIIPECYVDTNLIEALVPTTSRYNHQKGCGTVARVMQNQFSDRFALGIIDKDKRVLNYLSEFNEVCKSESLVLHKHSHAIIILYRFIQLLKGLSWITRMLVIFHYRLSDYQLSSMLLRK